MKPGRRSPPVAANRKKALAKPLRHANRCGTRPPFATAAFHRAFQRRSLGQDVKRPPTDYKLLRAIYSRHRDEYAQGKELTGRAADILVPIDIPAIANELGVDSNSVFGRLYYHLDRRYGEERKPDGGPRKVFFTKVAGEDRNCVNFPLLEAVLASLWQQNRRDLLAIVTAVVSLAIALAALIVSIVTA